MAIFLLTGVHGSWVGGILPDSWFAMPVEENWEFILYGAWPTGTEPPNAAPGELKGINGCCLISLIDGLVTVGWKIGLGGVVVEAFEKGFAAKLGFVALPAIYN